MVQATTTAKMTTQMTTEVISGNTELKRIRETEGETEYLREDCIQNGLLCGSMQKVLVAKGTQESQKQR